MSGVVRTGLLVVSALITAGALVWWWRTFGEVVGYGYLSWTEAGRCLVSDSDICTLAKALCSGTHPRDFLAYWTSAFWVGFALFSLSLFLNRSRDIEG